MRYEANPTWSTRLLFRYWNQIRARVPEAWLPVGVPLLKEFQEYGKGHYGVVFPTHDPNIVCKLTTDATEAAFISIALKMPIPDGMTQYQRIYALPETFHGRPVFIVWRESAFDVGGIRCFGGTREQRTLCEQIRAFQGLADFVHVASKSRPKALAEMPKYESTAWRIVAEWSDQSFRDPRGSIYLEEAPAIRMVKALRGPLRLAVALRGCEMLAETIANEPEGYLIGQAFQYYIDAGILLADVHLNNIGKAYRWAQRHPMWVITDPGHAVMLDARHGAIEIEVV